MTPLEARKKANGPKHHSSIHEILTKGWDGDTVTDKHGKVWMLRDGELIRRAA